jgi:glutaredoxin-like YruB-family protein
MALKVKVYSTSTCPWCDKVKDFLKKHKIKFEESDVGIDVNAAREMIEKTGQMAVPIVEINGEFVIGYDEERLKELLHIR